MATWSFWRYALFSWEGGAKILAAVGFQFALMEGADFLDIYSKDQYENFAILVMLVLAVVWVVFTRRPITRFVHKVAGKDVTIEVCIGDLFDGNNDVVVSANTSFDTDMASGLIDTASVQGQFATRFFNANTANIDVQLEGQLNAVDGVINAQLPGKQTEYPIGTVAKVTSHNRTFYFVAMAGFNAEGTAHSTPRDVEDALDRTWDYIRTSGNLRDLSIPIIGTGRGRIPVSRTKMIDRIAQSYVDATHDGAFLSRLKIVIHPNDAEKFSVNLYEIRDYVVHGLRS